MAHSDEASQAHRDMWRNFCRLTAAVIVGAVVLLSVMALTLL
jgi:hypothetical protein